MRSQQSSNNLDRRLVGTCQVKRQLAEEVPFLSTCVETVTLNFEEICSELKV
jgi:hypothetical protein